MNIHKIRQLEDLKRDYKAAFTRYTNKEGTTRKDRLREAASTFVDFFKKESFAVDIHQNICVATYGTFRAKLSLAGDPLTSKPISIEVNHDYSPISLYQIELGSSLNVTTYYPPETEDANEKVASEIEMLTKNMAIIKEWENADHFPTPFFAIVAVRDSFDTVIDVPENLKDNRFGKFDELLTELFLDSNVFQP